MPNYNSVTLIGHLTRDPELRAISSGMAVSGFSIAVNRKVKEREEVSFFDCKAWGSVAEAVAERRKGDALIVVGELRQETWDDKATGAKRSKVVVNAYAVGLSLYTKSAQAAGHGQSPAKATAKTASTTPDDDIPF